MVGLTLGPRAGRPGHQAHAKNDGAKNVSGQQRSPPARGAGSPRNSGTLRQGGWGGRAAEQGAGPLPRGGGSSPPGGGLGGLSRPRGRRRGKVHGSGGVVVAAGPPPGRGRGQRAWPPPPRRRSSQHAGRRAGAGSAGGSWRRVPAYTPGGDFSVMPLSTSSIRSSSITTAGTGGGRVGEGTRQLLLLYPGPRPVRAPGVPPGAGQRGKGGSGGYDRDEGGGSPPGPAWRGSMPPAASRLSLDG